MTEGREKLLTHLASGITTVCRAWALERRDGVVMGFTDHDRDLNFAGVRFRASSGMTAGAIQQSTGLSVDNGNAIGALSDAAITDADILAGRYDGAEVRAWLVNWVQPEERELLLRGGLGEVTRSGAGFEAELRGLAERLNQPQGRVYQRDCSAVLGDRHCRFDTAEAGFSADCAVIAADEPAVLLVPALPAFADHWFAHGRLVVLDGPAAGLEGLIKTDRPAPDGRREIRLWQALGIPPGVGTQLRLHAGCDRRADTCRNKFNNFMMFRGFPHIPGEDWLGSFPSASTLNDGGSLRE